MRQLLSRKSNLKDRFDNKRRDDYPPLFPQDAQSAPKINLTKSRRTSVGDKQPQVAERAQLVPSHQGPPRVTTSASTQGVVYRRCEDEPIHAPGTIQNFGALLGLKYNSRGDLQVRIASENSRSIIGYGVEQLFALPSFLDVLQHETRQEMIEHISYLFHVSDPIKEETQLDIFRMVIGFPYEPDVELWCALHLCPNAEGLLICEFEKYVDSFYTKDILAAKKFPAMMPIQTSSELSAEEFKKSTTSASKPLPVLEVARKRDNSHFSSMDIFKAMTQSQKQISACTSLSSVFDVVVGIVAEITDFHRVMLYRFDTEMNGRVESELLDPRASEDFFRGMHFPASDIPAQAQRLYVINRIRLLHDRAAETARLVCRNKEDFSQPLDLTHSYLRSISPVHCKYLANMDVRATMSISLVINQKLWGLIACHQYGEQGIKGQSNMLLELCRTIGESASFKIQQLLMAQRIEARTGPIADPTALSPDSFIGGSSTSEILRLVDADCAYLSCGDKSAAVGFLDPYEEALAVISYLQSCHFSSVQRSHNIRKDFPGLAHVGFSAIGGLLFIPLQAKGIDNPFLVFMRKSQLRQVRWAGNPYAKKMKAGTEYLQPRNSFKKWEETIAGTSREWTEDQMDTASVLSTVYNRMIESWRDKKPFSENAQMDLIRNSAHEFDSPLNVLIHSLEMASEDTLDERTRDMLKQAYEASNSIFNKIERLRSLTDVEANAKNGSTDHSGETFDLKSSTTRALQTLHKEARRNGFQFTMSVHDQLPGYVKGNNDQFKTLLDHLVQSALKLGSSTVQCNVFVSRSGPQNSTILIQVKDSGPNLSGSQLKKLIEALEDGQDEIELARENQTVEEDSDLAIAAIGAYVKQRNGKIQVTNEPTGTLFSLELPFEHVPPRVQSEDPRRIRNIFHLPASRTPRDAADSNSKSLAPIDRSAIGPPSTNPFINSQSAQHLVQISQSLVNGQPRPPSSENASPPEVSYRINRSSRPTPSTSPSPPVRTEMPNHHRSSRGSPSRTPSPPLEAAKPIRRQSKRSQNTATHQTQQLQQIWDRSDSPSPPPNKALPAPPIAAKADAFPATPVRQENFPLPPGRLEERSSSLSGNTLLSTVQEDFHNKTKPNAIWKLNILIADDDPHSVHTLDEKLSKWGARCTLSSDGQECHDRFEMTPDKFDVILMELKSAS
ncbi:sensor histidine kinase/response regulator [Venturia nashicola]|nr:sensor histidine kinase/response regulator [Venturia nashicola]